MRYTNTLPRPYIKQSLQSIIVVFSANEGCEHQSIYAFIHIIIFIFLILLIIILIYYINLFYLYFTYIIL